jgi:hypothetical protein
MSLQKDLLRQAQMLASREPKHPRQASLRRAVSTAYYALFHLLVSESLEKVIQADARNYVQRVFEHGNMKAVCVAWSKAKPPDYGGVAPVTARMITPPLEAEIMSVATTFKDLQEARHEADYDTGLAQDPANVAALLLRVEQAFADWAAVRNTSNAKVFLTALIFEKLRKQR